MAKHLDTRVLTPNFARGEVHCKRRAAYIDDGYDKECKYHYCCHGGHGKRKANVANYIRDLSKMENIS